MVLRSLHITAFFFWKKFFSEGLCGIRWRDVIFSLVCCLFTRGSAFPFMQPHVERLFLWSCVWIRTGGRELSHIFPGTRCLSEPLTEIKQFHTHHERKRIGGKMTWARESSLLVRKKKSRKRETRKEGHDTGINTYFLLKEIKKKHILTSFTMKGIWPLHDLPDKSCSFSGTWKEILSNVHGCSILCNYNEWDWSFQASKRTRKHGKVS